MTLAKKQEKVYEKAGHILLAEHPQQDANERIGLLTVMVGLRPVALFLDIEKTRAEKLRRVLGSIRLSSMVASGPKVAYTWQSPHPTEIVDLFRRDRESQGLWVCHDAGHLPSIKKGVDQIVVGQLLRYPQCCIDAQQLNKAKFEAAVIDAYIRFFGTDRQVISRALLEDRKVKMEWEDESVPRTTAKFPFVQHIACEACLASESSPTAGLNSEYERLVVDVDPALHDYLDGVARRCGDYLAQSKTGP